MHKLFKIGIIAALIFLTLGLGFVIAAVALGATWAQFIDAADTGNFLLSSKNSLSSKSQTSQLYYSDVECLDISFSGASLELKETDGEQILVEILSDPYNSITTNLDDGTLEISTKSNKSKGWKNTSLCIHIPEDQIFDEANLNLGATEVTAQSLNADELNVKMGAGIFTGTGEIRADESTWEVGVGQIDLAYLKCEDLTMECGMGTVSATLSGSQEDYDCDITCNAGTVDVGDKDFIIGHQQLRGDNAENEIKVNCGMGTVDLMFDEGDTEKTYLSQEAVDD